MQALQQQDVDALRALYDRYHRVAFALAYRILGDAPTAEEVVQDVFQTAWQRAKTYDIASYSNVRGWLMTITHRRSIDQLRSRHQRMTRDVALDDAPTLATPDIWEDVSVHLLGERVRSALQELPDEQRRVIEQSYFDGMTHADIAAQDGTALGTVKGRMRLGLRKLSALLEDDRPGAPTTMERR